MLKIKHYIIVELKQDVNKHELFDSIKKLFEEALNIEGIDKVNVAVSNSNLSNRYDIMIEMNLTKDALDNFDNSEIHRKWKNDYGKYIIDKTIFDCDI